MTNDTLKSFQLTKHSYFDFKVTTLVRGFLKDKDGKNSSDEDLESEIIANGKLLDEKIALDEIIFKLLTEINAEEESLFKKHKEVFDLYQSRKLGIKAIGGGPG